MNHTKRISLFNELNKSVKHDYFNKKEILGQGDVGRVIKMCNKNKCISSKQIYLTQEESLHVDDIFSSDALRLGMYIELSSMQLTNELVINNICPHFVLNYNYGYKVRENSICNDKYPIKFFIYNELIKNATTLYDFLQDKDIDIDIDVLYNIFFQIIVSLYSMMTYFDMMHLDLHSKNILVEKVRKGGYYEYIIGDKKYKLPNVGVRVFIIDFGHAYIPDKMESWFITKRYNKKNTTFGFDIKVLMNDLDEIIELPDEMVNSLKFIIKNNMSSQSIFSIFGREFSEQNIKSTKLLSRFDMNKKIE